MKRIVYAALTVLFFITFYALIPVHAYYAFTTFFVMVGALLTVVFLGAFAFSFKAMREPKGKSTLGCVYFPILLFTFFGLAALFIYREIKMEKNELCKHGRFAEAVITGGSSTTTRRADFSHIYLEFYDNKHRPVKVQHDISARQFQNYSMYEKVYVYYSTEYPDILSIVNQPSDTLEYAR